MFKDLVNQKCNYCNSLMGISTISDPMFRLSNDKSYLIGYYSSGPDTLEFSIDLLDGRVCEFLNFLDGIKIVNSSLGFECFNYDCPVKYCQLWELRFSEHHDSFYLESANIDIEELSLIIDNTNFIVRSYPQYDYSLITTVNQRKQEEDISNICYINLKQPLEEIIKKIETIRLYQ